MGKNKFKTLVMLLGISLLLIVVNICSATAASFVAEMVVEMKGKKTISPFFFKDSAYRFDTTQDGVPCYFIVLKEDPLMSIVVPKKKGYTRLPKEASIFMKNNLFETPSFVMKKKYYKLGSKSDEKVGGLKCIKEVYTIEGPSGPEKAVTLWIAKKYEFPVKIVTYYKGKELCRVELKNLKEKDLDSSLFEIPEGYRALRPSDFPKRSRKKPAWTADVKSAEILSAPFEKVLNKGDIVRVKIRKGYGLKFRLESPGRNRDQWARVAYFAFKDGKKVKNLGEFGGFAAPSFREPPEGADEIVLRVSKGTARIWADEFPSNLIEAGTVERGETKMFSPFHFAEAKRLRITLADAPKDGISSLGELSVYKDRKELLTEKYYLKNGTSKSWDLSKFGNKVRLYVKVKRGKLEVRIEDASISAPTPTFKQSGPPPVKAKVLSKPQPHLGGIKFGQWKIKRFLVMPGLSKAMPAGQWEICLNEKNVVPLVEVKYPVCKFNQRDVKGSSVFFDFTLSMGQQRLRYKGKATFNGDKLQGEYLFQESDGNKGTFKFEGERLGKCK